MGCILGVCAAQAACCCCSAGCSLCCACCPSSVTSIMTRLMYLFMLILGILTASMFLIPQVKEKLAEPSGIPFYDKSVCGIIGAGSDCEKFYGYASVYRVWFAFVMFFLLMAVLTIGVRTSKDCRASLQNGFWFFKFLILIGIMIGAFFIKDETFNDVWLYIGLIGGVLFIFVQVLYLIDFAHSWTESWIDGAENGNKCYYVGFIFCSLVMYGFAIAGFVGAYVLLASGRDCHLSKGLISVNLILCVIVSIIALLPRIQEANPTSGILQASLVSLYVSYLTFSAVGAHPEILMTVITPQGNITKPDPEKCDNFSTISGAGTAMIIVGIVLAVLTILVVSFKAKGDGGTTGVTDEESPIQKVADDEEDGTQYSYWFFHLLCLLASLYFMMVMTNWYRPESINNGYKFDGNWPSVWVQIIASWLCIALYGWTLIAPIACPDRTFSFVADKS